MKAILAIFVTLITLVNNANAIEPVRLRADANVVDSGGNVIGVPNTSDSRNNRFETFYYSVDSSGNYSNGSVFKVTSNPHNSVGGGFVRINVSPENGSGEADSQFAGDAEGGAASSGDVVNYAAPEDGFERDPTVSYNNDNVNKSRYDFDGAQGSVYGDF